MRTWLGACRGALAFLTRLPVSHREDDWEAFRARPATFPFVGLVVGALAAVPLLAADVLAAPTVALGYLLAVYAVVGIHNLDGVADLGDALVVHGGLERRREVLKDTTTGVGALLAVSLTVAGLALGALGVAELSATDAVGVAIAAEIGARLGLATMAGFGTASHEGMGSQLTEAATPGKLVLPAVLVLGVAVVLWPHPAAVAVPGALVGAGLPWHWARRNLGGVSGDVFGAAAEIGRVVGLHAGVIAWTLS
ncbi:adenosylcobinamide-GDP ribazoletransferase [Natronococcus sp. A-GB1]|uniref:adenosylcobinamide-GDP ribazoletransferase n=1 Tax=Natronococcus sp. A-GB1 TaxID=3037648 RepID=UPI0024204519|nr:adenosylcobinamide-GDP ribazoletransferase [Natronococcus sp. A-GB1]MDG5760952.1 adenosylcobinamide-GDP ribazoletransferase [Natronococcus sp. A-GB1]